MFIQQLPPRQALNKAYLIVKPARSDMERFKAQLITLLDRTNNKAEMLSQDNLNTKAFQELVLYYLRERITHQNLEIKHLVATNIHEWFVFDAAVFDRIFAQNKGFYAPVH